MELETFLRAMTLRGLGISLLARTAKFAGIPEEEIEGRWITALHNKAPSAIEIFDRVLEIERKLETSTEACDF